jgi:hypothetical protein
MMRISASCVVASLAMIVALAATAAPSKFAGVWKLNRDKSEWLTGALANAEIRLIVTQDDKRITTAELCRSSVHAKRRRANSDLNYISTDRSREPCLKRAWIETSR